MRNQPGTLFPPAAVRRLAGQFGSRWAEIVEDVNRQPLTDPHTMAFTLTMRRLRRQHDDCPAEHEPLCAACACDLLAGCAITEQELVTLYQRSLADVRQAIRSMRAQRARLSTQRGRVA